MSHFPYSHRVSIFAFFFVGIYGAKISFCRVFLKSWTNRIFFFERIKIKAEFVEYCSLMYYFGLDRTLIKDLKKTVNFVILYFTRLTKRNKLGTKKKKKNRDL